MVLLAALGEGSERTIFNIALNEGEEQIFVCITT